MNALKTILDELDSETAPLPIRIMVDVLTLREAAKELARLRLVESAARKLLAANPTERWTVDEMNALDEALNS